MFHNYFLFFRALGGETASSSLSNTQIAEHYANCIKLSSENVSVHYSYIHNHICTLGLVMVMYGVGPIVKTLKFFGVCFVIGLIV